MLNTYGNNCNELSIKFNSAESKCILIGSNKCDIPTSMNINGALIDWVNKIKYLGITVLL